MSEEVYALIVWRDYTLGEKLIYLFKTKELAERAKKYYEALTLFDHVHVAIQALEIYYGSLNGAKGCLI